MTTKVFHSVEGDPDDHGLARERILRQIDGSLARLGVDQVDMYLIHEPDPATPIDETLDALEEVRRAGKVKAIGASNVDVAWLEEAGDRVQWVQNSAPLLDRELDDVPDLLRRPRDRLLAVQPAGRRVAGREVPPWRGAAARIAHDPRGPILPPSRR